MRPWAALMVHSHQCGGLPAFTLIVIIIAGSL